MAETVAFSVIIPTYTGQDTIAGCLQAIAKQGAGWQFELLVVVDGPNPALRHVLDESMAAFVKQHIDCRIIQLTTNEGRFMARYHGAVAAKYDRLLFVDDRARLADGYFEAVMASSSDVLIPTVIDEPSNIINYTVGLIRKRLYPPPSSTMHVITSENFDMTAKGTTSLWVKKDYFIAACKVLKKGAVDLRAVSDDTKLLLLLLPMGVMVKSAEAKLGYMARKSKIDELQHIFQRGPKFIDFYFTPGTRYYPYIVCLLAVVVIMSVLLLLYPVYLWYGMLLFGLACVVIAVYLAKTPVEVFGVAGSMAAIVLCFCLGVVKGLATTIKNRFWALTSYEKGRKSW